MADQPLSPRSNGKGDVGVDREQDERTPRWVYVFGIFALVLVSVFVILHLTGGGFRGHMPPSDVTKPSEQLP